MAHWDEEFIRKKLHYIWCNIWKENYQCFEFLILFDCVLLLRRLQTSRNVAKYQLINHKCFWTDNEINTFSEYTNIYTVTIKKKKMAKIATDRKANFFFLFAIHPFHSSAISGWSLACINQFCRQRQKYQDLGHKITGNFIDFPGKIYFWMLTHSRNKHQVFYKYL